MDISTSSSELYDLRFKRSFLNVDASTCWLNSCLQLVLMAVDRVEDTSCFLTELELELLRMRDNCSDSIDPRPFKSIFTSTEDLRISKQLSEVTSSERNQATEDAERMILSRRVNLGAGEQCVRDFFLCLETNIESWPEICSILHYRLLHSTKCVGCECSFSSETLQMYLDVPVPPDGSRLNDYLEEYFNQSELVAMKCEDECKKTVQKEKRVQLLCGLEAKFLMVVLSRGTDGNRINKNEILDTEEVFVRYLIKRVYSTTYIFF